MALGARALAFLLALPALSASADPVVLRVRETAGVARTGEVVRSGIPLPRSLNVTTTNSLGLIDANGSAVPAQFQILARWNSGRAEASAPVQWLLVSFPATVAANGSATYRLVVDGSVHNVAPAVALRLTQNGNRVVVDTGVATFTIDADHGSLFEEVRTGGAAIITGGALTARVNARDTTHASLRRLFIERSGPLSATVVVDGAYDWPAVGGGGLGSQRRYDFTAGSPTALVRHAIAWEGTLCGAGDILCGGTLNAVRVQSIRDTLRLGITGSRDTTLVGAHDAAATHTAAAMASIRQGLRASRTQPPRFELDPGGSGTKADGGLLAVSGTEGTVAIALDHMHRYEPQALRLLGDGSLAIDLADDSAWIANRQGLFATMAVSALSPGATRGQLDAAVWAPLNHPLHAWPDARWFATSDAIDDVPAATLPGTFARYDEAMDRLLRDTVARTDDLGVYGLMSWGLFPRTWADPIYSDEIDCFGADPTPGEQWDDLYWCSTWTDYHNAALTAGIRAMRSGETEWLDEITRPAALRQLHTQIQQCSPADDYFYCGQAPSGYGGYRADFNSSHAYFDNLQLYYWLTGDGAVVDTLRRGASKMRIYFCSRRPAAPCTVNDPPTDDYANLTGRVASQWNSVYRFVGLAGDDPGYLDDYRMNLARAVTQQYVAADRDGTRYGFLLGGVAPVTTAGTNTTDQVWITALYDLKMLERLRRDTNDAPIGSPPLRPSEVITAFARTLARYGPTTAPGATGTLAGPWPNQLDFTWTGPRIGGTLTSVRANGGGSDPLLYDSNKSPLAAPMAAAAVATGDPALRTLAEELIHLAIDTSIAERAPLGKIEAELTVRLHSALARLFPPPASPPPRRRVVGR
jgi:hypothetical protein